VLDVDVEKERISLGIKQMANDPFQSLGELKKGAVVTCTVAAVDPRGITVTVGDGVQGYIRKAELSRDRDEQRPDRFSVGDKLDAKIVTIDGKARKLTLSVKALEMEEDRKAMEQYGSTDSGASLGDILGAAMRKKKDEDAAQ
jgi:small subunit ribosomal protein S1